MAYYKYQTSGKTANALKAKRNQKIEGTLELAPNVLYNIQNIYDLQGVGVFSGDYRVKKLTKRIDTTGMSVVADVVKL